MTSNCIPSASSPNTSAAASVPQSLDSWSLTLAIKNAALISPFSSPTLARMHSTNASASFIALNPNTTSTCACPDEKSINNPAFPFFHPRHVSDYSVVALSTPLPCSGLHPMPGQHRRNPTKNPGRLPPCHHPAHPHCRRPLRHYPCSLQTPPLTSSRRSARTASKEARRS